MTALTPDHQNLVDTHGIDGQTVLRDAAGKELKVSWSEAGNFIFLNPGGWGDGRYFLTTILFEFLARPELPGLCLHETEEGCLQMIPAEEMARLKDILIKRYTHND